MVLATINGIIIVNTNSNVQLGIHEDETTVCILLLPFYSAYVPIPFPKPFQTIYTGYMGKYLELFIQQIYRTREPGFHTSPRSQLISAHPSIACYTTTSLPSRTAPALTISIQIYWLSYFWQITTRIITYFHTNFTNDKN